MNNSNRIATVILFTFLLFGCKKEEAIPYSESCCWGEVSMLKNGELWKPKVAGSSSLAWPGIYGVNFMVIDPFDVVRQIMSVRGLPADSIGVFRITSDYSHEAGLAKKVTSSYYLLEDGGDALAGVFYLDTLANNVIEITEIKGDEVKGVFNITLLRDTISRPSNLEKADTLRITEGRFHTRIFPR